jgi:hypothetical protein
VLGQMAEPRHRSGAVHRECNIDRATAPGRRVHGTGRQAIIVVTHDDKIIPTFKRIYHIRDGRTEEEAGQGLSL